MKITARLLHQLRKIVTDYNSLTTASATLQYFHQETQIGRIEGNTFVLSATDRQQILQWCQETLSLDLINDALTGNRISQATHTFDEKVGASQVFTNRVLVTKQRGAIALEQGETQNLINTCLQINLDDLCIETLKQVIIVENGAAILDWHKMLIAEELSSTLAIYRGHGQDSKALHRWLTKHHEKLKVIASVDIDPAGFSIANSLNADSILLPTNLSQLSHLSIKARFDSQINQLPTLADKLKRYQTVWQTVYDNRIAISQESLIANQIPLTIQ